MKASLHPYQKRGAAKIIRNPVCALYKEMGLGKTLTTLAALRVLYQSCEVTLVLVVAPKRVAVSTWPAEVERWGIDIPVHQLCNLSAADRAKAYARLAMHTASGIALINYELLVDLVEFFDGRWPFDMVVLDESTKMKNPSAKRVRALRRVREDISRMVLLSGSPAPNGLKDLWAPHQLLDRGRRLGRTFSAFKNRWFSSAGYGGYALVPTVAAAKEIPAAIEDITISMRAEDYLEMPELVRTKVRVDLPPAAAEAYQHMESDFYMQLAKDKTIIAANAAVKSGKLLQLCNGAVYDADGEVNVAHQAKLDALEDVLEEAAGAPVLVAYQYQHDLARLRERFPQGVTLDSKGKTVDEWNAGRVPLLFIHPASAGHGLNLQHGGNIIVWFGMTWNLEHVSQTNARLWRQGQTKPVFVYYLMATGTIDFDVHERVEGKKSVEEILMARLKEREIEA